MTLDEQPARDVTRRLSGEGLAFRTGPFTVRLHTPIPSVHRAFALLYRDHPIVDDNDYCDFTLGLEPVSGVRRWIRPQVALRFEEGTPFEPMPIGHAFALFEWSLNWCISAHAHTFLILHAAVVEREGCAAILAAPPGSGKSTLCAALTQRGWRLLSDELALISLATGQLVSLARPVSLKNESEHVIRTFAPEAVFGSVTPDTTKGTVVHLKPKSEDVRRMDETARPTWVVFPRYVRGAPAALVERTKADAMLELGHNAFNYALLGQDGFDSLGQVIDASLCFDFSYGHLDDAVRVFDELVAHRPR